MVKKQTNSAKHTVHPQIYDKAWERANIGRGAYLSRGAYLMNQFFVQTT